MNENTSAAKLMQSIFDEAKKLNLTIEKINADISGSLLHIIFTKKYKQTPSAMELHDRIVLFEKVYAL